MVSNQILSYSGPRVFILTFPVSAFQDLGGAVRAFASEDRGKEVIKNLSRLQI